MMKRALLATVLILLWAGFAGAQQRGTTPRPCSAPPGRVARAFHGEVKAGQPYEQRLGTFIVRLRPFEPNVPSSSGWEIGVFETGRSEDLSRFTTPYSGPNDRDLFTWFDAAGNLLNLPGTERTFYFSPEVGRSIRWEDDTEKRRANQRRIKNDGRGDLDILEYRVGPAVLDGAPVPFSWIKFAGCLTWPE